MDDDELIDNYLPEELKEKRVRVQVKPENPTPEANVIGYVDE